MTTTLFRLMALMGIFISFSVLASPSEYIQEKLFTVTKRCIGLSDEFLNEMKNNPDYVLTCPSRYIELEEYQASIGEKSTLATAVINNQTEVVQKLLELGASPNSNMYEAMGSTSVSGQLLWQAIENEYLETALVLIDFGADVGLVMDNGHSLIVVASGMVNKEKRNILLRILAQSEQNKIVPELEAADMGEDKRSHLNLALERIIKNLPSNPKHISGSIDALDKEAIKFLTEEGADINIAVHGATDRILYHNIFHINNVEVISYLHSEYGLRLDLVNKYGVSKFDNAWSQRNTELINYLLEQE